MKTIIKYVIGSFLVLIMAFIMLFGAGVSANASVDEYTDVMADLKQDKTFNEYDFPHRNEDYSLYVIQIAETKLSNLCMYVYSPAYPDYDLKATEISLSIGENQRDLSPQIYKLKLLSQSGVFSKYMVEGLEVPNTSFRYYNLVAIYRLFNEMIDKADDNNNINSKGFNIGQQWCCYYINDELNYEMTNFETIQIINPYHETLRYVNGMFLLNENFTDSHLLLFSTDKKIDKLYEAYGVYKQQHYKKNYNESKGKLSEQEDKEFQLTYNDVGGNTGGGLAGKKYKWDRIQSIDQFIKSEQELGTTLTKDFLKECENHQWVLRFTETSYTFLMNSNFATYDEREIISEVLVLSLIFETNGKTYKLGAVSDRVTGDNVLGGSNYNLDFSPVVEWFQKIIAIIAILVLLAIISFVFPIVSTLFNIVWKITKKAVGFIVSILTFPFNLFRKKKH